MATWYRLDNAAKIFPSATNRRNSSVYRVSAVLNEPIEKELLQKAVNQIIDRFDFLFVRLKKGVFWHYLDQNLKAFLVEEETEYPCFSIDPRIHNGYLIRVLYFHNRISVEVFHAITDGGGAFEFLKSLLYYYLTFAGHVMDSQHKVLLAQDPAKFCDVEDSFSNYHQVDRSDSQPKPPKTAVAEPEAFHIKGTAFPHDGLNVIHGVVSAGALNNLAKSSGGTITSYVAALLIYSIYQTRMKYGLYKHPVSVAVPVNLRKIFPSATLRNFFGVVNLVVPVSEQITFEEILKEVSSQLKAKTQKEELQKIISHNFRLESRKVARFIPLYVKTLVMSQGFKLFGESKRTLTLSNLGNIILPDEMYSHLSQLELIVYSSTKKPLNCALCSTNDRLVISLSRTLIEADIIQFFFSYLAKEAELAVTVYSNDWGVKDD